MATCTITGTVLRVDGTPHPEDERVSVTARIVSAEQDQSGQLVGAVGVASDAVVTYTDKTGVFSMTLLQGAVIEFEIQAIHLKKTITVPSQVGPVDFSTLI